MKRTFFVLIGLLCTSLYANSQQYRTSIGVKGDWSTLNYDMAELSLKHFYTAHSAFEANLGIGRRFIWLEGMYHRNQTLKKDIDWYVGAGLDFGYWNSNYDNRYDKSTHTGFWGGSTGVVGLECTTEFIPINLALDVGPTVRLIPDLEIGLKVGFALRYAFR